MPRLGLQAMDEMTFEFKRDSRALSFVHPCGQYRDVNSSLGPSLDVLQGVESISSVGVEIG